MKKQIQKEPKLSTPAFATEAAEADWWYESREAHGKQLLDAQKSGEVQVLTQQKLRERIAAATKKGAKKAAPVVTLRIPEADLALARKQAGKACPTRRISNRCCMKRWRSEKSEKLPGIDGLLRVRAADNRAGKDANPGGDPRPHGESRSPPALGRRPRSNCALPPH